MILAMAKRKKKAVTPKSQTKHSEKELAEKVTPSIPEDEEEIPAFGILPSRDLKKNLGCG